MIPNSPESDLILEFVMSQHFATDRIQSWIDNFSMFDSLFVNFYTCNAFRETFNKFLGVITDYRRENLDCR